MAPRGGPRPGAGRPKGSKNQRTLNREALDRAAVEAGITPLVVLLKTMREAYVEGDAWDSPRRVRCCELACDAAPYCHAKYASVTVGGSVEVNLEVVEELLEAPAEAGKVLEQATEANGIPRQ